MIHFSPWTLHQIPDPRSQIPNPRSHTPQIPHPLLTSTVSAHSPIVIHFSPWRHHQIPDSQIPHTTNSTASPYIHGLSSFSYSDSLFTMDAQPDPRSQISDPRSHTPQIPQPLPTSTVSAHSPIVIHFSPWTQHQIPDPRSRSQIPTLTKNSTASPYVHGLSSFSYSDSLFTMDAPPDPRSQIPDPTHHKFHSLSLRPRSQLILL